MNKDKQRIAIAEACGWTKIPSALEPTQKIWVSPNGGKYGLVRNMQIPDYLNDLNAMHEAEKARFKDGNAWGDYFDALQVICWDENDPIAATASQRAEAFLRTIGKWEDEQ